MKKATPKENKKNRGKKLIALLVVVTLGIAALLGGTLAMQDYNQHRTNNLAGPSDQINVRLNEDKFDPDYDWQVGHPAGKEVSVTNNPRELPNVQPVYVRVGLREYFEIIDMQYWYAKAGITLATPNEAGTGVDQFDKPTRFLTAEESWAGTYGFEIGEFVAFDVLSDAQDFVLDYYGPGNGGRILGRYRNALDPTDVNGKFYIQTRREDVDGQYGKYLVVEINAKATDLDECVIAGEGTYWPFIAGSITQKEYEDDPAGFDATTYAVTEYQYSNNMFVPNNSFYANVDWDNPAADVRKYIGIGWNPNIVLLTDYAGESDVWIYDPISEYFYWSELLPSTGSEAARTTAQLIDSLTLLKQPEGQFFYSMHVDMQTVTEKQLYDEWYTADINGDRWNDQQPEFWNGSNSNFNGYVPNAQEAMLHIWLCTCGIGGIDCGPGSCNCGYYDNPLHDVNGYDIDITTAGYVESQDVYTVTVTETFTVCGVDEVFVHTLTGKVPAPSDDSGLHTFTLTDGNYSIDIDVTDSASNAGTPYAVYAVISGSLTMTTPETTTLVCNCPWVYECPVGPDPICDCMK